LSPAEADAHFHGARLFLSNTHSPIQEAMLVRIQDCNSAANLKAIQVYFYIVLIEIKGY
jgi:hypothetical protein